MIIFKIWEWKSIWQSKNYKSTRIQSRFSNLGIVIFGVGLCVLICSIQCSLVLATGCFTLIFSIQIILLLFFLLFFCLFLLSCITLFLCLYVAVYHYFYSKKTQTIRVCLSYLLDLLKIRNLSKTSINSNIIFSSLGMQIRLK